MCSNTTETYIYTTIRNVQALETRMRVQWRVDHEMWYLPQSKNSSISEEVTAVGELAYGRAVWAVVPAEDVLNELMLCSSDRCS